MYKKIRLYYQIIFLLLLFLSFSSSSSLLSKEELPQNWTEQQMCDFITDKIINYRTSLIISNGDEIQIKFMNRDTMNKRFTEFRQIQTLRKKHFDTKKIKKYYIPNMFNVDIDNRPTYTVAVPWNVKNCYDFIEYAAYDQILYYSLTYSYDLIPNPHIIVEGNKISIDPHTLVKYSSSFPSHTKKEWYSNQKPNIDLNKKLPSLDHLDL
jgi:hypothetical protein